LTAPDPAKKLAGLLKRLRAEHASELPAAAAGVPCADAACEGCPEGHDRLLWQLIYAFLVWEASTSKAAAATRRLHAAVVDYNEMRVCLADELMGIIGERYPRAQERVQRLRASLNDLYRREHAVTLAKAAELPKRDGRAYMESLEGMPRFVAARMSLLAFGGHAFPLDERLHQALLEEGALPAELSVDDASGWMERHFRAGEAAEPYLLLELWMNDRPAARPARRAAAAKKDDKAGEKPRAGGGTPRKAARP
jgi:hypothetical protein